MTKVGAALSVARILLPAPLWRQLNALPAELQRVATSTGWLTAEHVIRLAVGFLVGIYVARHLGPEAFGLLNYSISCVFLFSGFVRLGLDKLVVRELVARSEEVEILGTAFVLRLASGVAAMLLVGAIAYGTSQDPTTRLAILIIGFTLVFQPLGIAAYWFHAQVISRPIVQARLAALAAVSVLRVVFVLLDKPVLWFAWLVVLDVAVAGALTFLSYVRSGPPVLHWRARLDRARTMMGHAWPFALSAGLIDVQQRIDQFMLGQLLGPAEVGWYAAAARLSQIWYFVPVAIATAVFPAIVRAKESSSHAYKRRMQSLYDLTFWLAIVVALPMTVLSDVLIAALYGDTYAPAAHVMKIHVWTIVFVYTGTAASQWHFAENAAYLALLLASVRTLACLALNLLLIPSFGPAGAAWALLLANAPVIFLRFAYPRTRPTATMLVSAALAPARYAWNLISRSRYV